MKATRTHRKDKERPSAAMLKAINRYQVPGAVAFFDPKGSGIDHGWREHSAGTLFGGIGHVFLGMPKGFNRLGPVPTEHIRVWIFESFEDLAANWEYDKFNVPVWKHLDEYGNTLVRGLSPRTNWPFLHVILGNHLDKINCLEITEKDLAEMD